MTTIARRITGGVDTHLDTHVAAALDERGAQLGVQSFPATASGYRELLGWLEGFGTLELIGVEGTGSYGAGLTRHLLDHQVAVVEVDRPNRQRRRRTGKSDPHDAVAAARAAQGGDATGSAKTRDGNVEAMRVLRVARRSARGEQDPGHQPDAQPHLDGSRGAPGRAPGPLRLQGPHRGQCLSPHRQDRRDDSDQAHLAHTGPTSPLARGRGQRVRPTARRLSTLAEAAPELNAIDGVGTDVASAILVAAGDNSERLKSESTFAKLCGVSPLEASSGKQQRHRLNRSGDAKPTPPCGTSSSPEWSTTREPSTTSSVG